MANTTQKALDLCRAVKEEITLRCAALGTPVVVGDFLFDSVGNPYFQIGTGAINAQGGLVYILPYPWPSAKDVLGNAAIQYTPHVVRFCSEKHSVAGYSDRNLFVTLLPILAVLLGKGAAFEWYQTASGTAPVIGSFIAGNLVASFDNLYYPLVSGQ